jgi:hypothetical protein
LASVAGKKSRTAPPFIDAIWRYNMIQHLEEVHPQYVHPNNLIGHPLPAQILASFTLTALEQEDANIPMSVAYASFQGQEGKCPSWVWFLQAEDHQWRHQRKY